MYFATCGADFARQRNTRIGVLDEYGAGPHTTT